MIYLTIVIDANNRIYNISNDEHPTIIWANEKKGIVKSGLPKNAFCCSEEEYMKMMNERDQKIKLGGYTLAEIERNRREAEGKSK